MRQTLFYIPSLVGGYPLFGFGLAFWGILLFTAAAIIVNRMRRGTSADCWNWLTTGMAAAAVVAFVLPVVAEPQGLPVRGYGVFLMLGIASAAWLLVWRGRRLWKISSDSLLTAAAVSVLFGVLGARIFYICEYWHEVRGETIQATLVNMINVTRGGLVVYGSIIGGILALVVYLLWKKMPVLATLDLFAPALLLGLAFGRLGCLMNGCCFGGPCEHWPGVVFPPGSPAHVRQMELGQTAIGGIWLVPERHEDKTLFKLKESRSVPGGRSVGPVCIREFDPQLGAQEMGLAPGVSLLAAALCPADLPTGELTAREAAGIPVFQIGCNEDFILLMAGRRPDQRLLLVTGPLATNASAQPGDDPVRYFALEPVPDRVLPVHPTQIYSSLSAFVLCLILILLSRFYRKDGLVLASLFLLYPVNRFLLELVRTDEGSFLGTGLTVAQCISIIGFAIGLALFITVSCFGSQERGYARAANEDERNAERNTKGTNAT
ncbi:MAG: prolipoprotein diacylglyceryl transferase [Planctomycetia bacterium]|nr:prolipoprotein diacylglyceryl transferase [Planctomycetia bacterium]